MKWTKAMKKKQSELIKARWAAKAAGSKYKYYDEATMVYDGVGIFIARLANGREIIVHKTGVKNGQE